MTKYIQFYASIAMLALTILACKNASSGTSTEGAESYPIFRTDTLLGLQGCERAGFKAESTQKQEINYQNYTFRMEQKEGGGEILEVAIDSSAKKFKLPDVELIHFKGASRDHFFVEVGDNPDIRDLIVYSLKDQTLYQVYRSAFLVAEPPFVANGSVQLYVPVEESEVTKMPECPDKAAWIKKGMRIGYGQRYMYHMPIRGLTRKSEFICAPLEKGEN